MVARSLTDRQLFTLICNHKSGLFRKEIFFGKSCSTIERCGSTTLVSLKWFLRQKLIIKYRSFLSCRRSLSERLTDEEKQRTCLKIQNICVELFHCQKKAESIVKKNQLSIFLGSQDQGDEIFQKLRSTLSLTPSILKTIKSLTIEKLEEARNSDDDVVKRRQKRKASDEDVTATIKSSRKEKKDELIKASKGVSLMHLETTDFEESRVNCETSLLETNITHFDVVTIPARDPLLHETRELLKSNKPGNSVISMISLSGITVEFSELRCLAPSEDLSDLIIDACTGIYSEIVKVKGLPVKFYPCSFYSRLELEDYRARIPNGIRFLLIPVHSSNHWTLRMIGHISFLSSMFSFRRLKR
jgi:hypothetical protein